MTNSNLSKCPSGREAPDSVCYSCSGEELSLAFDMGL